LEHAHRSALEDHVHRASRVGQRRLLNVRIGIIQTDPLSDTPLTRIRLSQRLCSGRGPGVSLPKAHPTPPDQRRRHVANRPRCPRLYASAVEGSGAKRARWQKAAQLLLAKADVGAVSRQLELALLYDCKLDVRAMA
jgi:hypothetical protein